MCIRDSRYMPSKSAVPVSMLMPTETLQAGSFPAGIVRSLMTCAAIFAAASASQDTLTLLVGAIAMISLLTRPLTELTRVVEGVKNSGFAESLCSSIVPNCGRDDEVGRLSRTFRETFDRLNLETKRVKETDIRRREMVASVSHDLRTPLARLRLDVEMLGGRVEPEVQSGMVSDIEDMNAIIDQFIGFARSEDTFTADQILRAVGQTFRPGFQNRIDKIIVFRPLTRDLMRGILKKELAALLERRGFKDREWAVEWEASALEFLLEKGFTPEMGDWLDVRPQFPRGIKPLLDDIRAAGFVPGLWIAPFLVGNRSRLYREHPDWVVHDRQTGGSLAVMTFYGEFRWHKRSEEYYILDTTHPDAFAYLRQVFRTWRHEWGCEYFKTDFMHFPTEHGPDRAVWHLSLIHI